MTAAQDTRDVELSSAATPRVSLSFESTGGVGPAIGAKFSDPPWRRFLISGKPGFQLGWCLQRPCVALGRDVVCLPVGPRLPLCEDGDRDSSLQEADELVDRAALRARELLAHLLLEVIEGYLGRE